MSVTYARLIAERCVSLFPFLGKGDARQRYAGGYPWLLGSDPKSYWSIALDFTPPVPLTPHQKATVTGYLRRHFPQGYWSPNTLYHANTFVLVGNG